MHPDRQTWTFADGTAHLVLTPEAIYVHEVSGAIPTEELKSRALEAGYAKLGVNKRPGDGLDDLVAGASLVATNMALDVRDVPPPVGIELRRMTSARFDRFVTDGVAHYAEELFGSGAQPTREAALEQSKTQHAELFPQGLDSPGQLLWSAFPTHEEDEIGILWIAIRPDDAFIYGIEMSENSRGKGYGTQVLRAGAAETRAHGRTSLALNVFGHNEGARRLYEREGYVVTREAFSVPL